MKAQGIPVLIAAALTLAGTQTASAGSVAPVGGDTFNVKAKIDLGNLSRDDFDAMVTPVAKTQTEHTLVFYDFADTLCDLLAGEVARFTKETGIPAKHVCVDGDAATQQLIAAKQANSEAPADVFFGPNNSMRTLTAAGVVANIPLVDVLPNAKDLEPNAAHMSRGFSHGGAVLPFHRNQTVLAYNAAIVKEMPDTLQGVFDYAKANNIKVAVTNPTEGGSGSGFLETAMLALAPDCKNDLYDFSISEAQATDVAKKCMVPVVAYFKQQKALIEFTNGNEASLQAIANNVAPIATVWEDDLYTLASKGLVPRTTRPALLQSGEVGDGDGMFVVSSTPSVEASLLLANFLMSDQVQIGKMEKTGSRTARLDLSTAGKIPGDLATFLLPDQQYQQRTRPRINGSISDAAAEIFVKEVIAE